MLGTDNLSPEYFVKSVYCMDRLRTHLKRCSDILPSLTVFEGHSHILQSP